MTRGSNLKPAKSGLLRNIADSPASVSNAPLLGASSATATRLPIKLIRALYTPTSSLILSSPLVLGL